MNDFRIQEIINRYQKQFVFQKVEHAIVISANNGEIILPEIVGDELGVRYDPKDETKFPGNIYIHNHPLAGRVKTIKDEEGPRTFGFSLSDNDISLIFRTKLQEIHAVDMQYTYKFSINWDLINEDIIGKFFEQWGKGVQNFRNNNDINKIGCEKYIENKFEETHNGLLFAKSNFSGIEYIRDDWDPYN